MAVKIRLKRLGRKKRPFYRIVAIDSHARRDGKEIERLGWYDPLASNGAQYQLKDDRIYHWLGEGAQPTKTVHTLLSDAGIAIRWHFMSQGKSEAEVEEALKDWDKAQAEQRKRDEALKAQKSRETTKAAEKKAKAEAEASATAEAEPAAEEAAPAEEAATEEAPAAEASEAAEEATAEAAPAEKAAPEKAPVEEASDAAEAAEDESSK